MKQFIIGIDVGGTKVAGGLVTRKGKLSHPLVVPTLADKEFKKSFAQITQLIGKLVRAAGGVANVGGIGICAPRPAESQNWRRPESPQPARLAQHSSHQTGGEGIRCALSSGE